MLDNKSLKTLLVMIVVLFLASGTHAQTTTATLSGSVTDEQNNAVASATVKITNTNAGFERTVTTNSNGTFIIPLLPPATYRVTVERNGFAPFEVSEVILNGNDERSLNLRLKVGAVNEYISVTDESPLIDTKPAVSTTIDRNLIENMPLNGRSLQTLIALSPGVVNVPVASNGGSPGQFSVNGQRSNSNYFTVDGVSGNFSTTNFQGLGQQGSGSIPSTGITGSFTSLASIDALQEFTIQTSTTSAQFGRSPGAQVSFTTRAGTNDFHGSLFEYIRNDRFDAKDFFDLTKPPLRFNNFGGTFGGPVVLPWFGEGTPYFWKGKDKTFFFFSYEGQRFVLPQSPIINLIVPSAAARRNAPNAIVSSILNAFPTPTGAEVRDVNGNLTGGAFYSTSYSDPSDLDSWSLRVDQRFNSNVSMFVRGNISPSSSTSRSRTNPSTFSLNAQKTEMLTASSTQVFSANLVNEFTANISRQSGDAFYDFDGLGGASAPDPSVFFPPNVVQRYFLAYGITNVHGGITLGPVVENRNRQFQVIDNLSYSLGSHQLKFGADYRRLLPLVDQGGVIAGVQFPNLAAFYNNQGSFTLASKLVSYETKFQTYSFYGQDTWKVNKKLTLDYGVRWEIAPSPTAGDDIKFVTLTSPPDLSQLNQTGLTIAPLGTPYYKTEFTNLAPRFGISYLVNDKTGRELVLRGGIGIYYDLGQSGFGNVGFPYSKSNTASGGSLPIPASFFNFPDPSFTPGPTNRGNITVAAPNYTQPRTYQWNITAEQSLGANQTVSVAYVAALGRKLVRVQRIDFGTSATQFPGTYYSPNFSGVTYFDNDNESSYHSMQIQFNRRLSRGLQLLANYTWSHSIDNGSNDSALTSPGQIFPQSVYYGNSDFDVRHNFSSAATYLLPMPKINKFTNAILRGWSLNGVFSMRSGLPYNITVTEITPFGAAVGYRRPNLTGAPLYLDDASAATGRRLNPAAFSFILPAGQMGNLGRNVLRGPNFWQADIGLNRRFNLTEKVKIELRADAFNVFNHPNFLYPGGRSATYINGVLTIPATFGRITQTAGRAFGGGSNTGGFNPLFQNGGPRSMQFSARLSF